MNNVVFIIKNECFIIKNKYNDINNIKLVK